MSKINLLKYKHNIYSQNGEDGVIGRIFEIIGQGAKVCCEFGAWDGVRFSNTRSLITQGWTSVQIESDQTKFKKLCANFRRYSTVYCIRAHIDNKHNSLPNILERNSLSELSQSIDFLSIDIDGLDFEIFAHLKLRPRVICVEVNAGHFPDSKKRISAKIAQCNVGQPLGLFTRGAEKMGYRLIAYTGNAFYVNKDIWPFGKLSDKEAYVQFLRYLTQAEREWLFLVNLGVVAPHYKFRNPLLSRKTLNLSLAHSIYLNVSSFMK